jgi:hypothetical protein
MFDVSRDLIKIKINYLLSFVEKFVIIGIVHDSYSIHYSGGKMVAIGHLFPFFL